MGGEEGGGREMKRSTGEMGRIWRRKRRERWEEEDKEGEEKDEEKEEEEADEEEGEEEVSVSSQRVSRASQVWCKQPEVDD